MEHRVSNSLVQPQSRLLCLPREMRCRILELSVDVPVSRPGDENRARGSPHHPSERAAALLARPELEVRREVPSRTTPRRLPGLTASCKLLYIEGTEIWYRHTELTFASAEALLHYFRQRPLALRLVQRIRLFCGPAKHGLAAVKAQNKAAIRLLTDGARHLIELSLVFKPYWGIHYDRQLLSTYWYFNLCRLRPLIHLSLSVSPLFWQGPVGIEFSTEKARTKLRRRVQCTEDCFRQALKHDATTTTTATEKSSKNIGWGVVRNLRRSSTTMACDLLSAGGNLSAAEPRPV